MTQPAIILSHDEHVEHIHTLWRQNRIDLDAQDIIFAAQLRAVEGAMFEPEPTQWDKAVAVIWSGYFGFIAFGGLLFWELVR
jgi:hypothetical protein